MTETPAPLVPVGCIRGCVTPGLHLPGCGDCWCACHNPNLTELVDHDVPTCAARHLEVGCEGCRPEPTQHGLLCWADWRRLADALGDRESKHGPHGVAWVYDWLRENREPGSTARDGMPRGGREAPAPLNVAILDVLTSIERALEDHTAAAADALNLHVPSKTVAGRASWLLTRLELVAALDVVTGLWDDLLATPYTTTGGAVFEGGVMVRAHVLAPWRPGLTRHKAPCPLCGTEGSVVQYGGEVDLSCQACKSFFDSNRWHAWAAWAENAKRESDRALLRQLAAERTAAREAELAAADPEPVDPVQDDVDQDAQPRRRRRTRRSA